MNTKGKHKMKKRKKRSRKNKKGWERESTQRSLIYINMSVVKFRAFFHIMRTGKFSVTLGRVN